MRCSSAHSYLDPFEIYVLSSPDYDAPELVYSSPETMQAISDCAMSPDGSYLLLAAGSSPFAYKFNVTTWNRTDLLIVGSPSLKKAFAITDTGDWWAVGNQMLSSIVETSVVSQWSFPNSHPDFSSGPATDQGPKNLFSFSLSESRFWVGDPDSTGEFDPDAFLKLYSFPVPEPLRKRGGMLPPTVPNVTLEYTIVTIERASAISFFPPSFDRTSSLSW